MCRLLEALVNQTTNGFEETIQYREDKQESETLVEQSNSIYQEEKSPTEKPQVSVPPSNKRVKLMPSSLVGISAKQSPADLGPGIPIKEGLVEKKGHSVAFLMWPK